MTPPCSIRAVPTAAMACALLLTIELAAGSAHAGQTLTDAQQLFYNGRYADAISVSASPAADDDMLAVHELRSSAWLFQLRRAIGEPKDKEKAFKACDICTPLMENFMKEFTAGRVAAQAVLKERPDDADAKFYLGKLDLNYVWLVLGTLGRKTGWNEYWEARHSLDAVLVAEPDHLRARVARAWIDYIVDTRMPWGTAWMLGGGNKKRALTVMREAVDVPGDRYDNAEALFGLWDMQVREKNHQAALVPARRLAELFPENVEIAKFVAAPAAARR